MIRFIHFFIGCFLLKEDEEGLYCPVCGKRFTREELGENDREEDMSLL